MSGKGSSPRPFSVTPSTYAENYARIQWTEDDPPGHDARAKFCPPLVDSRETMRQRHLAEAKAVIHGTLCHDLPPKAPK